MGNFLGDQRKISPENSGEIFRGPRRFELKIAPEIYNLMLGRTNEIANAVAKLDRVPGIFETATPMNDHNNYVNNITKAENRRPYELIVATDSVHDKSTGKVGVGPINPTFANPQQQIFDPADAARQLVDSLAVSGNQMAAEHIPEEVVRSIDLSLGA